jgi:hypothetical protein
MVLLTCPERPVARSAELVPEADHYSQHAQAHHNYQVHHLIGRHPSISHLSKEESTHTTKKYRTEVKTDIE